MTASLDLSPAVAEALRAGKPVVALESTIIAHGMPFPQNLEMARNVEKIIRDGSAVPATIAVVRGRMKVGLEDAVLDDFARRGAGIMKASTRDLGFAVARGIDAATTVASTMRIAALAGIAVFATGGIGGVHRGAEQTFDISNDLDEIASSNVAVVTAGAKSILDLGLTLEALETRGVPVIGFGTDDFPAFYSRNSGLPVPMRSDIAVEIAKIMRAKWQIGLTGGVVVANPIPREFEIPAQEIEPVIDSALRDAEKKHVGGKALTPFLLARLAEATEGRSLAANIALVENNARLAAEIAVAYASSK
jgi:pseudouridine-5'-phosphate glycosidase